MIERKNWIYDQPISMLLISLRRNRGPRFIASNNTRNQYMQLKKEWSDVRKGRRLPWT